MLESLEDWFGQLAARPSMRRILGVKPKKVASKKVASKNVYCRECGHRKISKGNSVSAKYSQKYGICRKCYASGVIKK